ncbi:MAG TPA: glycoside hydrolase domain-containing protein [Thermoleophilaceae bacterium]|nr:glycoside hydrolase domain-containing protein [Thermoleophilaceae bacterium]
MATYIHGLDRESEPGGAALAKRMLDQIGGHWWNIYIGGPYFKGKGWSPAQVQDYAEHGIERFMLTYVGRQAGGTLTRAQGLADGRDALNIAAGYGYSGNFPLCLDLEAKTYPSNPGGTLDYVRAWCSTVKAAGARPGIYSNPSSLIALHGKVPCDFVWVASWISHGKVDRDPRGAPHMPNDLWPAHGQRAWQTSGQFVDPGHTQPTRCAVLDMDVDIGVADIDCLAHAPGVHAAPAHVHALRKGDRGPRVRQLTRRLSYVPAHATGKPYLDGERALFDANTDTALKTFQMEHHIKPRGIFGVATQHALGRSVELEKARRKKVREGFTTHHPVPSNGSGANGAGRGPLTFASLVADVRRLDAETDRAWKLLVAYAAKRHHAFEQDKDKAVNLADIARILNKMETTLETLVSVEEKEVTMLAEAAPAHAEPTPAPVPVATGAAVAEPAPPAQPTPTPAPPHPGLKLEDLTDPELLHRVDRYDHAVGASREVLIGRYAEIEKQIARITGSHPAKPTPGGGGGAPPVPPPPLQRPKIGVRKLQAALNKFTREYLHGMAPIAVDGKKGPETKHRIRDVKFYLGYAKGKNSAALDRAFLRRLRKPGSPRYANAAMLARARARRRKQRKLSAHSLAQRNGTTVIDGYAVANWIAVQVLWAREHGGWTGKVLSGYRTPEYSEHVCMRMYHRPSVPGKCAGRSSNHVGLLPPAGAVDVSNPEQFAAAMRRSPHSPTLSNALPATDPRHFSHTGH